MKVKFNIDENLPEENALSHHTPASTKVPRVNFLLSLLLVSTCIVSLAFGQTARLMIVSTVLGSTAELPCNIPYDAKSTNTELTWVFNNAPIRESSRVSIMPDGTLCDSKENTSPGVENLNELKREGTSDVHSLKLGIKRNPKVDGRSTSTHRP